MSADCHHFPIRILFGEFAHAVLVEAKSLRFLSSHSAILRLEHLDCLLEDVVVELGDLFIEIHHHGEFVVERFDRERIVTWEPCVLGWEEHCGEAEGGGSLRVELLGLGQDCGGELVDALHDLTRRFVTNIIESANNQYIHRALLVPVVAAPSMLQVLDLGTRYCHPVDVDLISLVSSTMKEVMHG